MIVLFFNFDRLKFINKNICYYVRVIVNIRPFLYILRAHEV